MRAIVALARMAYQTETRPGGSRKTGMCWRRGQTVEKVDRILIPAP